MLFASPARAKDCFDKALNEPGADWHDRIQIARTFLYHDKPVAAIDFALQAQELNPAHPTPWTVLASCYLAHGRREKAHMCVARALEADPDNRIAKLLRAQVIRTDRTSVVGRIVKGWFKR
jgi:cytochrome c-type biogenesis protein CcmH/NrfG